jgi:hypothetical protein
VGWDGMIFDGKTTADVRATVYTECPPGAALYTRDDTFGGYRKPNLLISSK